MMFGREPVFPIDLLLERPQTQDSLQVDPCEYIHELRTKIEDSFHVAREHLKSSAERQKCLYGRKVSGKAFNTGDQVWLLVKTRKRAFHPSYRRNGKDLTR